MAEESKLEAKLDAAFGALKTFDWGSDSGPLAAIDDACVAGSADAAARAEVERRLAAVLAPGASRACKDYVCRKLALIGTAASVPALAPLLSAADDAHLARYALERMTCPEAAAALRMAVETTKGNLQLGAISSLGGRRDEQAVPLLGRLLGADPAVAVAAARALGRIGSEAAARTLAAATPAAADAMVSAALDDARLACGDAALRRGQRAEALGIFRKIEADSKGKPAARSSELAAIRGILAALDETTVP